MVYEKTDKPDNDFFIKLNSLNFSNEYLELLERYIHQQSQNIYESINNNEQNIFEERNIWQYKK